MLIRAQHSFLMLVSIHKLIPQPVFGLCLTYCPGIPESRWWYLWTEVSLRQIYTLCSLHGVAQWWHVPKNSVRNQKKERTKGQFPHPWLTACYCASFSLVLFLNQPHFLKPKFLMHVLLLPSAPVLSIQPLAVEQSREEQPGPEFSYLWPLTVNNTLLLTLTAERYAQLYPLAFSIRDLAGTRSWMQE